MSFIRRLRLRYLCSLFFVLTPLLAACASQAPATATSAPATATTARPAATAAGGAATSVASPAAAASPARPAPQQGGRLVVALDQTPPRSEERRVGEEWRSR